MGQKSETVCARYRCGGHDGLSGGRLYFRSGVADLAMLRTSLLRIIGGGGNVGHAAYLPCD